MAFLTSTIASLAAGTLHNNPIAAGVANTIATVSPWFEMVPYVGINGQSLTVNLQVDANLAKFADSSVDLVADATASAQVTTTVPSYTLKSIVGQAQVGELDMLAASGNGVDLMAVAVEAKARDIARKVYKQVATGTTNGDANGFSGIQDNMLGTPAALSATDQTAAIDICVALDNLMDDVTAQSGKIDFIMMHPAVLAEFRAKARSLNAWEYFTTPITNRNILAYSGVPIFRNDDIPVASTDNYHVYAGCWETGGNDGVAMLYPGASAAGITVQDLGTSQTNLGQVSRVVQHTAFAIMNKTGFAATIVDTGNLV